MSELSPLVIAFGAVFALLAVGLYGLLAYHNLIKLIIALQILGKAAVLALAAAGLLSGRAELGQSLAVVVIVADTMVAALGLALAVQVKRRFETLDIRDLSKLRG